MSSNPTHRLALTLATIALVAGTLCAVAGRAAWQRLQPPRIATVDLTQLIRLRQQQAAAAASTHATSPQQERVRQAAAFGPQLDRAIGRLSAECRCVLLLREAVVAGDVPDLTPRLAALIDQP